MAIKCTSLTNSIQDVFSIPAKNIPEDPDNIKAITTMIFCNKVEYNPDNPTVNGDTITVYAVPYEDSENFQFDQNKNLIINKLEIPAGETFTFDSERITLTNGDAIKAMCNSNRIVCTISSVDLT